MDSTFSLDPLPSGVYLSKSSCGVNLDVLFRGYSFFWRGVDGISKGTPPCFGSPLLRHTHLGICQHRELPKCNLGVPLRQPQETGFQAKRLSQIAHVRLRGCLSSRLSTWTQPKPGSTRFAFEHLKYTTPKPLSRGFMGYTTTA